MTRLHPGRPRKYTKRRVSVNVYISADLRRRVDKARGPMSLVAFVESALREKIEQ